MSHCIETWKLPDIFLSLPKPIRLKGVDKFCTVHSKGKTFRENELTYSAHLPLLEEIVVTFVLALLLFGPLICFATFFYTLFFCNRVQFVFTTSITVALSLHPLPNWESATRRAWFTQALYKYFSFRFIWR